MKNVPQASNPLLAENLTFWNFNLLESLRCFLNLEPRFSAAEQKVSENKRVNL